MRSLRTAAFMIACLSVALLFGPKPSSGSLDTEDTAPSASALVLLGPYLGQQPPGMTPEEGETRGSLPGRLQLALVHEPDRPRPVAEDLGARVGCRPPRCRAAGPDPACRSRGDCPRQRASASCGAPSPPARPSGPLDGGTPGGSGRGRWIDRFRGPCGFHPSASGRCRHAEDGGVRDRWPAR